MGCKNNTMDAICIRTILLVLFLAHEPKKGLYNNNNNSNSCDDDGFCLDDPSILNHATRGWWGRRGRINSWSRCTYTSYMDWNIYIYIRT